MKTKKFILGQKAFQAITVLILGLLFPITASATWMDLCGYVYLDCNNNGIYEPQLGELPIANVDVTLSGVEADGAAPPYAGTTQTGADGRYCFMVRPGTYRLTETQPAGVPDGKDTVGSCGAGSTGNDVFVDITLTLAQFEAGLRLCDNYNFGELCSEPPEGSIGDTVFCDTNANGVQDQGELGIPGVPVSLTGPESGSAVTDASGKYLFTGLPAGTYVVAVDVTRVPDECSGQGCPVTMTVALSAGEIDLGADFCFTPPPPPGSIGDTVFCDTNANGVQDEGELGIPGVPVALVGPVDSSTVTGPQGKYLFTDLPAGVYVVAVDATQVPDECSGPGCPTEMMVELEAGTAYLDADFCFTPPPAGPGTGTPGYWKNHPEAWPVDQIVIGGVTYTKAQAITTMKKKVGGNKWLNMFAQLVSAKLNVLIGNQSGCIDETIEAADAWMAWLASRNITRVAASSAAWTTGSPLHYKLDQYNNGLLCAPHRD